MTSTEPALDDEMDEREPRRRRQNQRQTSRQSTASTISSFPLNNPTTTATTTTTTLSLLPRHILQTMLAEYCDGYTLYQFWKAFIVCQRPWNHHLNVAAAATTTTSSSNYGTRTSEHIETVASVLMETYQRALETRLDRMQKDHPHVFAKVLQLERQRMISQQQQHALNLETTTTTSHRPCRDPCQSILFRVDYCVQQHVPWNVVWCGTISFQDPSIARPFNATAAMLKENVKVMIVMNPQRWTKAQGARWYWNTKTSPAAAASEQETASDHDDDGESTTTTSTNRMEVVLQSYNFVPTPPNGRVVGMTMADRLALERVSARLDQGDLVGTVPGSYRPNRLRGHRNPRRRADNSFLFRMISYAQARRRVAVSPLMIQHLKENERHAVPANSLSSSSSLDTKKAPIENVDIMHDDKGSLYCSWEYDEDWDQEERSSNDHHLLASYRSFINLSGLQSTW